MDKKISIRDAFGRSLVLNAKRNKKIVVVSCDLKSATKIDSFFKEFPERSIEVGIAEANAIGIAAGLSFENLRPFVVSFGSFISGKNTEIRNSISYNKAGVVIVGTHSGLIGSDGATQSALQDIGLMTSLEGFQVFQPCSELDTMQIMNYLCKSSEPAYLRISRNEVQEFLPKNYIFKLGEAFEVIKGSEKLVISSGAMVYNCYRAINNFKNNKIGLLNLSSLKPINEKKLINILNKYKKIIIIEDHYILGGLGSIISDIVLKNNIKVKVLSHGMTQGFIDSDIPENLEKIYKLDPESIRTLVDKF
jgi:transketolase